MAGNGGKLGRKQEEAIIALLSQRNIEDAARAAGVGARTLVRWLKLPEFRVAYREARRATFSQSIARLQQASSAAATTLLKIMLDPAAPASTRVRAADSVLDHAKQAIEIEDIDARVSELERASEASKEGRGAMRRFGSSSTAGTP
jgi:phosphomannomutase